MGIKVQVGPLIYFHLNHISRVNKSGEAMKMLGRFGFRLSCNIMFTSRRNSISKKYSICFF